MTTVMTEIKHPKAVSRRLRLNSSRKWVNSFSLMRNSLRAVSHSSCETALGCFNLRHDCCHREPPLL